MHYRGSTVLSFFLITGMTAAFAAKPPLDCSKKSLAEAVADVKGPGETILFTGVCSGPVVIRTDGLTLAGVGSAIVDGAGAGDSVTIAGAHGVSLTNFEIRNGVNGILGVNGAHFDLTGVNTHDNLVFGISLQTASSAVLSGVTTSRNGVHGLDLETGSAAAINGVFTTSNNRVFGINVNGSSITFSRATVSATGNALGIQVATGGNAFLNDSATVLNVTDNHATGLTVVSGAHMVSFGGTINVSGNPVNGVSVNSKGGLDLDAGSTLNIFNNGQDGLVLQEASVMTVFNIPQFSGVPGFSTVNSHNNTGNGISVKSGSTLTLSNQARILSNANTGTGFISDNASATLVNSNITGNGLKDLQLTFGSRADLQSLIFGSYGCDTTVLVRGTSGITCPH
jgi:hypothetical protein